MKLNSFNILIYSISLGFFLILVTSIILLITSDLDKIDLTLRISPLIFSGIIALATILLVIITGKYAESTAEILEEQRKSREIELIVKKLKFYYPLQYSLSSIISNENYDEYQFRSEQAKALIKTLKNTNTDYYLASPELRKYLNRLLIVYERWTNHSEIMTPDMAWEELRTLIPDISKLIHKEIGEFDKILNESHAPD